MSDESIPAEADTPKTGKKRGRKAKSVTRVSLKNEGPQPKLEAGDREHIRYVRNNPKRIAQLERMGYVPLGRNKTGRNSASTPSQVGSGMNTVSRSGEEMIAMVCDKETFLQRKAAREQLADQRLKSVTNKKTAERDGFTLDASLDTRT